MRNEEIVKEFRENTKREARKRAEEWRGDYTGEEQEVDLSNLAMKLKRGGIMRIVRKRK